MARGRQARRQPNLFGVDIDTYGGSLSKAAAGTGYDIISPWAYLAKV